MTHLGQIPPDLALPVEPSLFGEVYFGLSDFTGSSVTSLPGCLGVGDGFGRAVFGYSTFGSATFVGTTPPNLTTHARGLPPPFTA